MRNGGAAQKIRKRRRVLIALRAVVISSVAERSLLQNGQRTICAISITACFKSQIPNPKSLATHPCFQTYGYRVSPLGGFAH